jgi:hypothetical protein
VHLRLKTALEYALKSIAAEASTGKGGKLNISPFLTRGKIKLLPDL